MPQLEDLRVDFVSLVDRAAVRDPEDPSEPMRFLLTKSETVWMSERAESAARINASLAETVAQTAALTTRIEALKADNQQLAARIEALQKRKEEETMSTTAWDTAKGQAELLRKADPRLTESDAILRVFKADPGLQGRYLAERSPQAAAIWKAHAPKPEMTERVAKSERLIDAMRKLDETEPATAEQLEQVTKARRELEAEYLAVQRPWAA
jgi:hypothetical protein